MNFEAADNDLSTQEVWKLRHYLQQKMRETISFIELYRTNLTMKLCHFRVSLAKEKYQ